MRVQNRTVEKTTKLEGSKVGVRVEKDIVD